MKMKSSVRKSFEALYDRKIVTFLLLILFLGTPLFSQLPPATEIANKMTIGWNIGNSLEVPSGETGWGNPKVNQKLIDAVSRAGFNTIRIPCAWDSHANQSTLKIDTNFLQRVSEVVDYCYAHNMYVIINCHWDGGWLENNVTEAKKDTVNKKQKAYWTQIANYFKEYDQHLLFAGANEPNVDNSTQMAVLMSYHQTFIDAVRSTGGNNSSRVLIIQGPSTDIDKTNQLMASMPTDQITNHLMAEVHYYTPWNFCGLDADASWGKMFYFWGKEYHSTTNPGRNATWGEEGEVESRFQLMKTKFVAKGIPVIMGEFSAMRRSSLTGSDLTLHIASREYYYQYIFNAALRYGMVPVYWDNGYYANNQCGLFDRNSGAILDQGAVNAILRGTTSVKEQQETLPILFSLHQNYPNPFNPTTHISYTLPSKMDVSLKVFDVLGREVETLFHELKSAGSYEINWNAARLTSGVYFYRLQAGSFLETRKLILLQ
jgi:endoglucanase